MIGERTFTRESGMGVDMVRTQPLGLFGIRPDWVGQEAKYVLGKKSGLKSIEMKAADLGLEELSDEEKKVVLTKVKELGLAKKGLVDDNEFRSIVDSVRK